MSLYPCLTPKCLSFLSSKQRIISSVNERVCPGFPLTLRGPETNLETFRATWGCSSLQVANTLLQPPLICEVQTQLVSTLQTEGRTHINQNWAWQQPSASKGWHWAIVTELPLPGRPGTSWHIYTCMCVCVPLVASEMSGENTEQSQLGFSACLTCLMFDVSLWVVGRHSSCLMSVVFLDVPHSRLLHWVKCVDMQLDEKHVLMTSDTCCLFFFCWILWLLALISVALLLLFHKLSCCEKKHHCLNT